MSYYYYSAGVLIYREVNTTGYQYFLESPISTTQRLEEDRVTYLNKSKHYKKDRLRTFPLF